VRDMETRDCPIRESNQRMDVRTLKSEGVKRCLEDFNDFQDGFRRDPEGAVGGEGIIFIVVRDTELQGSVAGKLDPEQMAHICEMLETMRNTILKNLLEIAEGGRGGEGGRGRERFGKGWEAPK